jgi:hypothetical protein
MSKIITLQDNKQIITILNSSKKRIQLIFEFEIICLETGPVCFQILSREKTSRINTVTRTNTE